MLGGLVSWVTTDLLRATGSLAPRGTVHQARSITDGCSTAPAEAAAQTLGVGALIVAWALVLSMDARAPRGACGDVGVAGHAKASRPSPLWHTRWRCEGRVSASTVAMVLKRTCAHTRPGARAASHHRRPGWDGRGLPVRRTRATRPWELPTSRRGLQDTPRGHRRARGPGMIGAGVPGNRYPSGERWLPLTCRTTKRPAPRDVCPCQPRRLEVGGP